MAPSPIPAPLPPWARALLQLAPLISAGLQFALDHIGEMHSVADPNPHSWRQAQLLFHDPLDADSANTALFTIDIANITNGTIDSTWTDADYAKVDSALATLVSQLVTVFDPSVRHYQRRYYVRQFNPLPPAGTLPGDVPAFAPQGPPERQFNDSQVGTAVGHSAPQVAISVTEKTAYPAHWGRFYLPFVAPGSVDATRRISTQYVDAIANATHACYQSLMAQEFFPVVPVTQINKQIARGLLTVDQVQVDNVFDVIRRRRSHTATYRKILP